MIPRVVLAIFVMLPLWLSSALAQRVDMGVLTSRLNDDMTEQQVIQALGWRPNTTEQQTCGNQSSTGSWNCRVLRFIGGGSGNTLTVLFARNKENVWIVNSWFMS
jgi:hypothetical protein